MEEIRALDPEIGQRAAQQLLKEVRVGPTLVKYAEASAYEAATRSELRQAAAELMQGVSINAVSAVELLEDDPLEVELATTLLYEHCHYPYRQIRERVEALPASRRQEIIDIGLRNRGRHDELLRAFSSGQGFRFDILMDIGGFRDMHRHRRCIQIGQDFTWQHGFDVPAEIADAGLESRYSAVMQKTENAERGLAADSTAGSETDERSHYVLPLAYRKRTLFKMDFAEVVYISELRTTPAGHISYRQVAYAMYEEAVRRHPELKACFRVTDVREPVDLLKR